MFGKADIPGMKSEMFDFQQSFLIDKPESRSVSENWEMFATKLTDIMNKYIPSKMSNYKHTVPWITSEVKRMCRKKQKLYNRARKSQNPSDWNSYIELRKATQKKIRQQYWSYQNDMLNNPEDKSNKAFWRYIKSKKAGLHKCFLFKARNQSDI